MWGQPQCFRWGGGRCQLGHTTQDARWRWGLYLWATDNRPSPNSSFCSDSSCWGIWAGLGGGAGWGRGWGWAGLDLYQGIKGLFLMVLRDDFCQQLVLALGQLDEGTDAVDVGIGLHV